MSSERIRCGISPVLHGGFPDNDRPGLPRKLAVLADQLSFDACWVEDHSRLPNEEWLASQGDPAFDQPLEDWTTPAFLAERWTRRRDLCRVVGRDPAEIRVAVPLMAHLDKDRGRARESLEGYIA